MATGAAAHLVTQVNMIVPVDGSDRAEVALGCGRSLATKLGGELVVVAAAVSDDDYEDLAAYLNGLELPTGTHREIRSRLSAAKAIDTVTRWWAPSLVCMSSRGRTARSAAVLGSVTAEVLMQGAAPILIVGPAVTWTASTRCESVLVCIEGGPSSIDAVAPAVQLASELAVPVRFVTIVNDSGETNTARESVHAQLADNNLSSKAIDVLVADDVAAALVERTAAEPGMALAMATHGRTRTQKLVTGSVALAVIKRATSPVLAVPPHRSAKAWRDWRLGT